VSPRFEALIVGVGGQGVLTAAQILGAAAHAAGLPVVVGQLHGMSQRGGSVQCSVIIGAAESSFNRETVDALIAYEPLEALRALPRVGAHTRVLVNLGSIVPFGVRVGTEQYPPPREIVARLASVAKSVHSVDGPRLLGSAESRALNVVLVGAAAELGLFPIPESALLAATLERAPRFVEANQKAFALGKNAVRTSTVTQEEHAVR
jgi:indolepyruvate ferredoxin oxidoreductase beta subunit